MPIRKIELIEKRNAAILKDYDALYRKGFRLEVCLEKLSEKYWLTTGTLYNIIYAAKTQAKPLPHPASSPAAA